MDDDVRQEQEARRRLAALPGFTAERAASAALTPLPGLTNRVYKVTSGDERLCLRIPGKGTEAIIDRRAEAANARAAVAAGVAPEIVHFADDGTMLTRFVEGALVTPQHLGEQEGALARTAEALRNLHQSAAPFAGRFRSFETIKAYVALLEAKGAPLSDDRRAVLQEAEAVRDALSAQPAALRPCHCDPTGGNLIDTGERVWLIDWEYAAMNDPMWDLAYFSIESRHDADAESALLAAYLGRPPHEAEAARLIVTKAACDLLGATWALVQQAQGNRADDLAAYVVRGFGRAAALMSAANFERLLALVRRG